MIFGHKAVSVKVGFYWPLLCCFGLLCFGCSIRCQFGRSSCRKRIFVFVNRRPCLGEVWLEMEVGHELWMVWHFGDLIYCLLLISISLKLNVLKIWAQI